MKPVTSMALVCGLILVAATAGCSGSDGPSADAHPNAAEVAGIDRTRLPLGDGKYLSHAKKGYVFSCQTQFNGGGAFKDGPWIDSASKTWDLTKKLAVTGSVKHAFKFSKFYGKTKLALAGNGLPPHPTGVFPIQPSDPAYQYDRNPNSINSYTLKASLPRNPKRAKSPACVGGTIGVMKNGIPLYSAFDAGGRDAPAHEIQDKCDGHPQVSGQYHYHSLSACLSDVTSARSHSKLLGWALDDFGIYGPRGVGGEQLTTAKLDVCHGHTHTIRWNGRRVRMFHYHATLDFPYVVSCYRGKAITSAVGLGIGGGGQGPPPGGGPPGGGPP